MANGLSTWHDKGPSTTTSNGTAGSQQALGCERLNDSRRPVVLIRHESAIFATVSAESNKILDYCDRDRRLCGDGNRLDLAWVSVRLHLTEDLGIRCDVCRCGGAHGFIDPLSSCCCLVPPNGARRWIDNKAAPCVIRRSSTSDGHPQVVRFPSYASQLRAVAGRIPPSTNQRQTINVWRKLGSLGPDGGSRRKRNACCPTIFNFHVLGRAARVLDKLLTNLLTYARRRHSERWIPLRSTLVYSTGTASLSAAVIYTSLSILKQLVFRWAVRRRVCAMSQSHRGNTSGTS
jgi:hypothetical protein